MHDHLVIHITPEPWVWFLTSRQGAITRRGTGTPPAGQARQTTVLVDMTDCLPLALELPELSRNKLQQALPWAVEEQIAGNVEDQHVVAAGRDSQGKVMALVVARQRLSEWLESLAAAGIKPDRLLPDALTLPWSEGEIHILPVGERVLVRHGAWAAAAMESDLMAELMEDLAAGSGVVHYHGPETPEWLAGLPCEIRHSAAGSDVLVGETLTSPANLLQGSHAPASALRYKKHWIAAAGLGLAVVLAQFLVAAVEHWQLRNQSQVLQTQIEEQFRQAFPDAGRTVAGRERELAERELSRLRFGEAAGLIDLLDRTGPVLGGASDIQVRSLDYRDGQLDVRINAQGVSELDQLERRLQSVGLDARVQSASLGPEGADGRLRIREQSL